MKKYDLIVIDPPWPLKKLTHKKRPKQVKMDYSTMSISDISKLDIGSIADDSCWLFLWTTQKYLFDAMPIMKHWGFNHLLTTVWEKTYGRSNGMPLYGFRWNAEFILVGYKKKPKIWPSQKLIPAVFQAENIRHSQKPDLFYELVEPIGQNRIDLFARRQREGWDGWGNEVESDASLTNTLFERTDVLIA